MDSVDLKRGYGFSFVYTIALGIVQLLVIGALVREAYALSVALIAVCAFVLWQRVRWAKALGERNFRTDFCRHAGATLGLSTPVVHVTYRACDLISLCLLSVVIVKAVGG